MTRSGELPKTQISHLKLDDLEVWLALPVGIELDAKTCEFDQKFVPGNEDYLATN